MLRDEENQIQRTVEQNLKNKRMTALQYCALPLYRRGHDAVLPLSFRGVRLLRDCGRMIFWSAAKNNMRDDGVLEFAQWDVDGKKANRKEWQAPGAARVMDFGSWILDRAHAHSR